MTIQTLIDHTTAARNCLLALRRRGADAIDVTIPRATHRKPIINILDHQARRAKLRGGMTKRAYNGILTTEIHACLYHGCQVQWQTRGGS